MNETEFLLRDAQRDVERVHRTLVRKAGHLADAMNRLGERLEHEGLEAGVNEHGEVQGLGTDVDRLCGELHTARRTLDLLRRVAQQGGQGR
jgi:hypothetical protein